MSAPAEARAVVMAKPRPPVPPVTMAVFPCREKSLAGSTMGAAGVALVADISILVLEVRRGTCLFLMERSGDLMGVRLGMSSLSVDVDGDIGTS